LTLIRFLLIGAANTLVTGLLFFALTFMLATWLSYSLAFGCGVLFASYATPRVAFHVTASTARRVAFAGWYIVVYLAGLGVIGLLQSAFQAGRVETTILTLAVTAALGFAGARLLFGSLPEGEQV
jgi:putative flippase GtrA